MLLGRRYLIVVLGLVLTSPFALAQEQPEGQPAPPAATEVPAAAAPAPAKEVNPTNIDEEEAPAGAKEPETHWGVGAYSRFITTPKWMIELFVAHATPMTSVSFAGQVIRRKGNLDIVMSLEYANVSPKDGYYEEKGENPRNGPDQQPDFYHFDNLSLLSGDVSFIWHFDLTSFMALRYGPGIGLGVPLGNILATDATCDPSTSLSDLDNPNTNKCVTMGSPVKKSKPPIVPIVSVLAGLRFKLVDQLSLDIEGGWRFPSFFVGGAVGYFF